MPQHPPLYYQAMATVLRVERAITGGPASADRELALLRLVNVLLILPLPLLAWWAARRFGLSEATAVTASVALFAVPMLTHIGPPSTTTTCSRCSARWCSPCAQGSSGGTGRCGRRSRSASPPASPCSPRRSPPPCPWSIVAAYAVGLTELVGERWLDRARRVVGPLLAAGGTVLVLAGWWYVGVRQRTGSFTPSIEAANLTSALQPPGFSPSAGEFAGEFTRNLNTRFWGSFGWYTIRFPAWLAADLHAGRGGRGRHRAAGPPDEGGSTRLQRAFLLVPFLLLFGFVLARAWSLYATTSKFPFIQGRYLFAGIVGLLVLVALGFRRWSGRWAPLRRRRARGPGPARGAAALPPGLVGRSGPRTPRSDRGAGGLERLARRAAGPAGGRRRGRRRVVRVLPRPVRDPIRR